MARVCEDMSFVFDVCETYLGDLEELRTTIDLGKKHNVDSALLASAKDVAGKAQSRLRLQAALNQGNIEELTLSIQEAQGLLAADCVLSWAESILSVLLVGRAAKTQHLLRECMTRALAESGDGVLSRKTSLDLRATIRLGELHGIECDAINSANAVFLRVVPSGIFQCGVCLQSENDVHPLACCGRLEGSNVLCDGCISGLLARGTRCPFCRAQSSFR